ncbi:MAG: DNA polymerase III subunit delta [Clostridiales bacterium]|jgi:DNA polymerase-3 subunit delta|nr:DNA polymerase III subunit delta [Clostridiales bacterium]
MPITESELKKHLKEGKLSSLYFLYGEESYLTAHYASLIAEKAAGGSDFDEFNLQKFDGQDSDLRAIEEAVEALPLMADRKCVVVRDWDAAAGGQAGQERLLALVADLPDTCTLIFWQDSVPAEVKKNAKWKAFAAAAEKQGVVAAFPRKSAADIVRLLVTGAGRRGCTLSQDNARLMVERSGDDLNLLLNELDKLCALAGEGEITRQHIETAGMRNLEASVFDLAKAILQGQYERAYGIIYRLMDQREEPVSVLSVLSSAYADLYRAKVAAAGGVPAASLSADFQYRGREFRLRNAARDCARLSLPVLRDSLEVLAQADLKLKSSRTDKRTVLEQTAAELIVLAKGGAVR